MAVGDGGGSATDQLISSACALGSTTIDLSGKNLTEIPKEVLDLEQLEFLYLQGNRISTIPEDLFRRLTSLRWLDLRNNRLSELPPVVGDHRSLKNLLLEGNNIKLLPPELGLLKSLSGLNLTGNPLEFPPPQVIERGTQEVLKFLREHYILRLKDNGEMHLREERSDSSSSEELSEEAEPQASIKRLHTREEPYDEKFVVEERAFARENVKLPPIMKAATRPRDRSTGENAEDLLKGQRAKQFEQQKRQRTVVQPVVEDQKRPAHRLRKVVVPHLSSEENVANKDDEYRRDLELVQEKNVEVQRGQTDETTRKVFELKQEEKKATRGNAKKASKMKKRGSPRKENYSEEQIKKSDLIQPSSEKFVRTGDDANYGKMVDETGAAEYVQAVESSGERAQGGQTENLVFPRKAWAREVQLGDMVVLKVPDKLYIEGQPCLGKVTSLADRTGFITVHYYTGSYSGSWRPMMSRTSPYLRKVPLASVLCKFRLSSDGRMSPVTQAKVRRTVDARGKT